VYVHEWVCGMTWHAIGMAWHVSDQSSTVQPTTTKRRKILI